MIFPKNLVEKLAFQHYIDSTRPAFQNSAVDWRPEVENWFSFTEAEKTLWRNRANQWLVDWNDKYPGSIDYVFENWIDVDFNNPPS